MTPKHTLSCDGIESYLYAVEDKIRASSAPVRLGWDYIAPLRWYIASGRASRDFLLRLLAIRPAYIARILISGGSDQEVMEKIKRKVYGKDYAGDVA